MLFQLPRECRTYAAVNPAAQWGWGEVLANKTNYLLEILIWQNGTPQNKGALARHKRNKPKPFVPEFMKIPVQPAEINKEAETMTVDDVKSWLSVPRGI